MPGKTDWTRLLCRLHLHGVKPGHVRHHQLHPIINQPNAAILGVCTAEDVVALDKEGKLYNKKVMTLSLTFDHRLIDGAEAADFEKTLKHLLEDPLQVIL